MNDNKLDQWLRRGAGQGNEPPAPDGWDTPPEAVWEHLRASLAERKKKRRRFFILWFTTLGGLIALGWWAGNAALMPPQPYRAEVKNQPGRYPETNQFDQHRVTGETNSPAVNGFKPGGVQPGMDEKRKGPAVNGRTPTGMEGKRKESAVSGRTPGGAHTGMDEKRNESAINGRTPGGAHTGMDEKRNESAINGLQLGGLKAALPNNSGSVAGDMAYVEPAPHPDYARQEMIPVPVETKGLPLSALPVPAPSFSATGERLLMIPGPAPVIDPYRPRPKVYATAASGVFFTSRVLKNAGKTIPNGRESGAWTWQQGLTAGWAFHPDWALETGLQRTAVHLQAERLLRFRYRVNNEDFNNQRFLYLNSANDVMETSFGAVEMRMDVGREPSRPIDDLAVFRIVLHTDEQVKYWRIPVALRWSYTTRSPWQWSLAAGVGLNFEAGYDLQLTAARANRLGIRDIRARRLGSSAGLAPFMTDLHLGGQLNYRLSPRCSVMLTPEFRYGLSSMYKQGPFRSLALSGGVQAGVTVRL